MHIVGYPGSGKTTLGKKITKTCEEYSVQDYSVKDIDEFLFELDYEIIDPDNMRNVLSPIYLSS